jgi:ATP-binding cassette subfamily B protein/subfamily B ATP-binding cassette protein MsbA
LIIVVTILSTLFSLLQPWPMKVLVDHVLGKAPLADGLAKFVRMLPDAGTPSGLLVYVVIATLVVFAVNSTLDVVLTFSWIRTGQKMVYDLAGDLFSHVQRLSLRYHGQNAVGDSISRITGDSWSVHTVVDTLMFAPIHAAFMLVSMIVVMSQMNLGLTLLALVVTPFMVGSSIIFGKPVRKAARGRRETDSRIQTHIQRTLSGMPVVQAFAQEDREIRRFNEFADDSIRAQKRSTFVGSGYSLLSGFISTAGRGIILVAGAHQVIEGKLSIGSLLVFLSYLSTLQAQLKAFTGIRIALQGAGASIDRVMEILETEPEVRDLPEATPLTDVRGHLRLEQVTFGYSADRPVLHELSLEALPGQTVAIVGATGAGKSTLVSLIPRFYDPWQGRITLDGRDLRSLQLRSLRSQVAIVLQEPFLFPLTIAENIAYGRPDATQGEIEAAARAANAHQFIERLPEGYQTSIGERGATLSGGERQRLSIARALLKDAPLLILDEPTSALDAETEELLLQALKRLMAGRTTFIIAHRLSTIREADTIVVLRDGHIIEQGSHFELLARDGAYASLHSIQRGKPAPTASMVQ